MEDFTGGTVRWASHAGHKHGWCFVEGLEMIPFAPARNRRCGFRCEFDIGIAEEYVAYAIENLRYIFEMCTMMEA